MPRIAAVLMMLATVPGLAGQARAQEEPPLLVGLFRVDCVALPFAAHDTSGWRRLSFWSPPPVVTESEGPWLLLGRSGELRELRPVDVEDYSGGPAFYEAWGVRTDHEPCETSTYRRPVRRTGIVLSERREAIPFREVAEASSLFERVAAAVSPAFDELERQELARVRQDSSWEARFGHPASLQERRQEAVQVSSLHAATREDEVYLHFVARRSYPLPDSAAAFRPLSVFHGWGLDRGESVILRGTEVTLDSGSEKLVSTYQPFALLFLKGERYAIAELREYESSVKQVLRWTPDGPRPVLPR